MSAPDIDMFFIADLLQKMEVYAEAVCLDVTNKQREHIAGTLEVLRTQHDEIIDKIRRGIKS